MFLETTRLRIIPLEPNQFRLLIDGMDLLEKQMGWTPCGESLDLHTRQAMEVLYQETLRHADRHHWYTNWQIILKSENRSIGSACFMREPDTTGEVEIGYGINEADRNRGYMTEAVIGMCHWAFQQDGVRSVAAETEPDNYASRSVLKKAGMKQISHSGDRVRWKITPLY